MSLVLLIVLALVAYIGLQYLRTFQGMVQEMREMRLKCLGSAAASASASKTQPATASELKDTFVSMLNYLKTSA
jgi:hypothetical protein